MIDNDDLPVGRILSRREVLALFSLTGTAILLNACAPVAPGAPASPTVAASAEAATAITTVDAAVPACVVRPELTEGPLFVDEDLNRSDIRLDPSTGKMSEGTQFDLVFRVSQIANDTCTPLAGVQVDVWHCDAYGVYSDTDQLGFQTVGQKFLRGYQITDENGVARFTTIYPGWYEGRTVHIHFKVRDQQGYDFTSQLFFDDAFTDAVFTQQPYASKGERKLRNDDDGIYRQSGGQMTLTVEETPTGYAAVFDIGLDMS